MRYLLTNDDGIYARGLSALYEELSLDADCLIVAPEVEQSAVGHAITISRPLMVRRAEKNGRFLGYAVAGTPADCVKIGIRELSDRPIDLVVSGINKGANVGVNVLYSGTVSAATEGVILGVSSLAVSLDTHRDADFSVAARFARKIAAFMVAKGCFINTVLNVNVPALPETEIKGIAVTRQGQNMPLETFAKRTDPRENTYYWLTGETQCLEAEEPDSDAGALHRGLISITPLHYDLTRHDALADLKSKVQMFFT
jgi:5'-nucleotidase